MRKRVEDNTPSVIPHEGVFAQSPVWPGPGVEEQFSQASGVSVCDMCCPQVYIGHSEPVQAVAFTPDQQQLLSVGDAIFLWDILALPEKSSSGRQVPPLDQNLLGLLLHPPP